MLYSVNEFLAYPNNHPQTGSLNLRRMGAANIDDLNALLVALQGTNISTLILYGNFLNRWNVRKIRAFVQGLQHTNITTLNLSNNDLGRWNAKKIRAFMEGLPDTDITMLDLRWNDLGEWNEEQIRALAQGLRYTNITTLDLGFNNLGRWNADQIRVFMQELEGAQITTLDLSDNDLKIWNPREISAFAQELEGTNITTLGLRWNDLGEWNADQIRAFMQGLQDTNITTLDLSSNKLHKWNPNQISAFAHGLKGTNITTLNLSNNDLGRWNADQIRAFMKGLESTQITTLDLSFNNFGDWNEEEIRALAQGLRYTNVTTLISESSEEDSRLIIRMVSDLIVQINSVEASEMTDDLYTAIESLDDLLFLLPLLKTGTDRLHNPHFLETINNGCTAILAMLFEVEKNFALFAYYIDKIGCISDDEFAFDFAHFLAFEQTTKLLFYRLVDKVNLDDKDLRVFYHGILAGDVPYTVFEGDLMTADEIREEAARQLSGLLEEGLYAGHNVIENYYSYPPLSEEEEEEKSIEIVVDHRCLLGRNLEGEAANSVQGSLEKTWECGNDNFELSVMDISILNSVKRVTSEDVGDTDNEFKIDGDEDLETDEVKEEEKLQINLGGI